MTPTKATHAPVRQEDDAVAGGTLTRVGIVAIVVSLAAVGVAALLLGRSPSRPPARVAPRRIGLVEQTAIEDVADGVRERAAAEARLHGYAWVDREAGVARVPIEVAMDLVAAEGAADAGREGGAP